MQKSAESVSPMHPDKLCDQISDAILDECLRQDPMSRVAVEVMGGHGIITITGEVTTKAYFNAREIAQRIAGSQYGVQVNIVPQSPYIAQGVDKDGAGDQGVAVGYACNDNEDMIPQEHFLARSLCKFLYQMFGACDGKTQITINEKREITAIVASFQGVPKKSLETGVLDWLTNVSPSSHAQPFILHCNAAGDWVQGGFEADTGLTGRKLAVDCYGTEVPIGGGAFSGKDGTKVDRSAAYMARKIAVFLLKQRKAKEVFVRLAYSIGVAEPVMKSFIIDGVDTKIDIEWDCTPKGMIELLKLREPQFEETAKWGHFGNGFLWDK